MTAPYNIRAIRALLEKNPDGLTIPEICQHLGIDGPAASASLKRDELTYIDRWTTNPRAGQWLAVWCLASMPADAPRPTIRPSHYLRNQDEARV